MRIEFARERSSRVNQRVSKKHCGKDDALCYSQKKTIEREQPEVSYDACECGERTPEDQGDEDEPAGAIGSCETSPGDLEGEVAKKEERTEQGIFRSR